MNDDAAAPLISVIITSYNYARYLPVSVGSVLGQDFPSFELVVVDNASTDDTDAVMATFAADARLRYVKNERNIGLAPNHNRGLALARGAYILFLSADDMLLPGHLRRCYDYLQGHPAVDVLYTGAMFMDGNGQPTVVRAMGGQIDADYDGGRDEFAAQLAEGCYVPWPSMLIRRSLYDELGGIDEAYVAADYEITVRWAEAGKRFAYLRVPSVAIRLHGPQASGAGYTASGRDLHEFLDLLDRYAVPRNYPRLRGRENGIVSHLRWRANYTVHMRAGKALDQATLERVETTAQRLLAIPPEVPTRDRVAGPLVSAIVRFETIPHLVGALRSLERQEAAPPWEAIVVGEGGADLGPLLRAQGFDERVRFVRLDGRDAATARNTGLRLTSGPIVSYLEPGSILAPHKLAELEQVFASGAAVVRSDVRLVLCETQDATLNTIVRETTVNGLYRGLDDDARDLVAPSVPLDAIAHLRSAIDRYGPFRTDLGAFDVWEFWLRMRQLGGAYVNRPSGDVRIIRQRAHPGAAPFIDAVQRIYGAYDVPAGSLLADRRARYLARLQPLLHAGAAAVSDEQQALQFLTVLTGLEAAELARA